MAEQGNSIHEHNVAISEKATLAKRDMADLRFGEPVEERNSSHLTEGDLSIAAPEHAQQNRNSGDSGPACPPEFTASFGSDSAHIHHIHSPKSQVSDASTDHPADLQVIAAVPVYVYLDSSVKVRRKRSRKEAKGQSSQVSKLPRKGKRDGSEDLSKQVATALGEWTGQAVAVSGENLNKEVSVKFEWKSRDAGLNQVTFDEATMPAPVCSCTGAPQRCYKWGNGGWQSACCTPTLSMYPLPFLPIKRHGRVSGRKMSGSAFTKLLSRMAAEGHDLSTPLDLKDHWAKHGTNGWITIK